MPMIPEDYDVAYEITKKQRDAAVLATEEARLVAREVLAMNHLGRGLDNGAAWDNLVEMARKVIS